MYAELKFGTEQWAVTWDEEKCTREYMESQFAFEAKRAAERSAHV